VKLPLILLPGTVKLVVILRVKPVLTFRVPDKLGVIDGLKESELQVLFPSTVRTYPLPIIMSSVLVGIVPPGHGAFGVVELQFPDPVVVMIAA